ncbi:hypothetical protein FISHEDRAFT_73497 [Fistulina hepatica ATCC 64428]|uniref:Transmembrane protein n=1 Tax=Fistulina hepatica ATCC 64428 TaxID=1128425 RepID=A0A0D7AC04_9AGAR|nr:hypothetical protein FISHEDRAFT_73497 [Fistulina hepatica ATCC 64428]
MSATTTATWTIDNISPLITYLPSLEWRPGSKSDSAYVNYTDETFTLTNTSGAYASFLFNGTGVQIYGAKRNNHGQYTVSLDNGTENVFDGYSATNLFQQVLYSASSLSDVKHTVVITNSDDGKYLDVDMASRAPLQWEYTLSENASSQTYEDTDSMFSYSPSLSWTTRFSATSSFSGNNGHRTSDAGACMTFNFTGEAVQIFGGVGTNSGFYTAQVDDGTVSTYNTTRQSSYAKVLLYHAVNLGQGNHLVTLTNVNSTMSLSIDYATVYSNMSSNSSDSSSSSSGGGSSLGPGVIAGIAVGAIAAVGIAIILVFFFRHRRQSRQINPNRPRVSLDGPDDSYTDLQMANCRVKPYTLGSPQRASMSGLLTHPKYSDVPAAADTLATSALSPESTAPSHQPQISVSRSHLANPWSRSSVETHSASSIHEMERHDTSATTVPAAQPSVQRMTITSKGVLLSASPPQSPPTDVPVEEWLARRMRVEGRETDYGPLPPAYYQATQPYTV